MTDRELLELAAKAAGNGAGWHSHDPFHLYPMRLPDGGNWNPLDDDGDAMRLAVKLGIHFCKLDHSAIASREEGEIFVQVEFAEDPYAATRRAIVRAAAEIGKRTTGREGNHA